MDPPYCQPGLQPCLMNPPYMYRPIYAYQFQTKSRVSLVQPQFEVPIMYCWSPKFVWSWLRSIGMGRYSDLFLCKGVDGTRLYHMEAEDLLKVGVHSVVDADQIITELRRQDMAVQMQNRVLPPGIPYNHYKSLYFGEKPFYLMTDSSLYGCSK